MLAKSNPRLVLVAILSICILPLLLAQAAWQWARPQGGQSYGQLIAEPLLAPDAVAKWQLLPHTASTCSDRDAEFAQLLQSAQHLQRAQGRDQTRLIVNSCPVFSKTMPNGLYLIDPHGNAVLRYSLAQLQDAKGRQTALREIGKILKNNQGLG
ncbi:hypothetical protein NT239_09970 [Chitinibacter sp. SCUT-21]|uniref:hypothetical protein n=1 Tax=Chitinibacter sp. SCUT-21 TaxID=2970891 RepID=UPI0035A68D59